MGLFLSNRKFFYSLAICLNFARVFASNKQVLEFSTPKECKSDEYFDTISLSCIECDAQKNLVPSADRSRCVCNMFSKTTGYKNGHPVCMLCGINEIATVDGKDCIWCKHSACRCSAEQAQIDRNLNGTLVDTVYCLTCPNTTYLSLGRSRCLPCNNFIYGHSANCVCPLASHTRIQNYCLLKDDLPDWLDVRSTYLVKFDSQNIDSYYLRTELQAAMYFCKKKDRLACEHLSNMCSLTLYANEVSCMLFMQSHVAPIWLFYSKEESTVALNSKRISEKYSLTKDDNNAFLNFTIIKFSLQGDLRSISRPNMPCNFLKHIRFGVNLKKECKITVESLLHAETEFFSPYLTFVEAEKILMHALPVRIKNTNENINKKSHWQLVRKFVLVDNISGFKALPNLTSHRFKKDDNLSVLRYMKSLDIVINVQSGQDRDKIFPPLLIMEYAELTNEEIIKDVEITLNLGITFTSKDNNTDYNLQIAIAILSGLALIFAGIKTWSYCKRNYASTPSINVLFWFLIYAMGAFGNVIILSSISLCIYLFIFYKGQTVPYILLPDESNERNIRIYTAVAFCFKIIEMIGFIYQYWNVNIFFIDWEQPKIAHNQFLYDSPHTSLRKQYSDRFTENDDVPLRRPSEIIAAKRKKTSRNSEKTKDSHRQSKSSSTDKYETQFSAVCSASKASFQNGTESDGAHYSSVSIWRTYFVANQWLKLRTKRKISVILQSVSTLLVFQVLRFYPWTLAIPELTTIGPIEGSNNFILYYAVCTLIYIVIYSIQWLFFNAFYERYIKNMLQEFVDLCSVANISVFILPFTYYGFYIHGRSVHGFADTDLPTLINNLKKEENNLCAHRGLVPGTTEQTFILLLTDTFRTLCDKFLKKNENAASRFLKANSSPSFNWKDIHETRYKLNQFLSEFVDHCFKDEDYVITEQYLLERLGDFLFTSAKEKSVFYMDNNHSFSQVSLYGNEWLIATLEITVFAFIIALYDDCILASIVTALLSMSLTMIVKYNWRRSLSDESFLDERFLV